MQARQRCTGSVSESIRSDRRSRPETCQRRRARRFRRGAVHQDAAEDDRDGPGQDDGEQADAQAGEVGDEPDEGRRQQEPPAQQPADDGQAGAGGQPGQFVGGVHGGRDERGDAEPGEGEAGQRGRNRRHGEGGAHADRGQRPSGPHDGALPEAVHDAVAAEAADGHGDLEGHDGQTGGGGVGAQVAAQVERAPGRAGVLDQGAARGQHAERGEHPYGGAGERAPPRTAGGVAVLGLGRAFGIFRAGEQEPVGDEGGHAEQRRRDAQVDREGDVEAGGGRAHQAAQDRADAPHAVQRIDDGPAVKTLHPQAVGVLRDVDDRVEGPHDEQHAAEGHPVRHKGDEQRGDSGHHDPHRRHARGAEAADGGAGEQPGQQRADRVRGQRGAEDGVAQAELGLDLRVARDDVEEHGAVGEEQRGDGGAGQAGLASGRGEGGSGHRLSDRVGAEEGISAGTGGWRGGSARASSGRSTGRCAARALR